MEQHLRLHPAQRRRDDEPVRRVEGGQLRHQRRELVVVQRAKVALAQADVLPHDLHGASALGPDLGQERERVPRSNVVLALERRTYRALREQVVEKPVHQRSVDATWGQR